MFAVGRVAISAGVSEGVGHVPLDIVIADGYTMIRGVSIQPAVLLNVVVEDVGGEGVTAEMVHQELVQVVVVPVMTAVVAAITGVVVVALTGGVVVVTAIITASAGVAATAAVVFVFVIIPIVAASIVIVFPVLVAHVGPLLLVHKLVGLESLQHELL